MKKLGTKITKTKVAGHQDCNLCHPETKASRALHKLNFRKEIGDNEPPEIIKPDDFNRVGWSD